MACLEGRLVLVKVCRELGKDNTLKCFKGVRKTTSCQTGIDKVAEERKLVRSNTLEKVRRSYVDGCSFHVSNDSKREFPLTTTTTIL